MTNGRGEQLLVVFVVFVLLFNYPLLRIFDHQEIWFGFPALYFYLFLVWVAIIVVIATIVRVKKK